jgi:hypothetical protein
LSVRVRPDSGAEFDRLVQQLEECRDALQSYEGPSIRRTVTDGGPRETPVDQRQQIVRDAARIMAALNAARHTVPPQQVRAYYEAAAGYARALERHTNNKGYVDRTIRAAEQGLQALDDWEGKHGRGLPR